MMTEKQWCVFVEQSAQRKFSVHVSPNGDIEDLRNAINKKLSLGTRSMDLSLWKWPIPTVHDQKTPIDVKRLDKMMGLDPMSPISSLDKNIFIVVRLLEGKVEGSSTRTSSPVKTDIDLDESMQSAPTRSLTLSTGTFHSVLEELQKTIFRENSPLVKFLHSFVKGDLSIPDSQCCVKGLPRAWLRSRHFPTNSNRPALYLLHPSQPHRTTAIPPSEAALRAIEKLGDKDMITLFGVAGCGKTRAVVEMLAQNWGLYFNGSPSDRGSNDVTRLFENVREWTELYSSSDKVKNGLRVQAIICCLLISRLIVLQHCLSLGYSDKFTCERWMLLQVCPGVFEDDVRDVFDVVFRAVLKAYNDHVVPLSSLVDLLQDRFRQVQEQIFSFASSRIKQFLVVLDEAQRLRDHGEKNFVSSSKNKDPRSILSPIIHGLRNISRNRQDYCVVTCGTSIDADELEILASSGNIAKSLNQVEHLIVDFPGWESKDQVAIFVKNLGDSMMDEEDRKTLHELLPEAAIQELFFRLGGRLIPITTTIEYILANGSTSYWEEAISSMRWALVIYPMKYPMKYLMRGNLCCDTKRLLKKIADDPIKYADALDLKHVLKQVVVQRAAMGLPWSLPGEEPILVESSFAHIRITDDISAGRTASTHIDEPFVFQAAYNFIKHEDGPFYEAVGKMYGVLQDLPTEDEISEQRVPLSLIYAFHGKQLKRELFSVPKAIMFRQLKRTKLEIDTPKFEPVHFPRRLFEHSATIVGWEDYEWGAQYKETLTIGDFMDAHLKHGSRKDNSIVPPFYFPGTSPSCPDVVFVLRIEHQLYPVFVKNILTEDIYPEDVEEARLTVHETRLKSYLPNLASYCPGRRYLSLIYSNSGISKEPREDWSDDDLWDSEHDSETHQEQCFKVGDMPLTQLLMIIDEGNVHEYLPGEVVDLLLSVKGNKRAHGQSA